MKTITVYYYSELSEESKKKAIDNVRYEVGGHLTVICIDARQTIEKFSELFSTHGDIDIENGRVSNLRVKSIYIGDGETYLEDISGKLLRRYINSLDYILYTNKMYFSKDYAKVRISKILMMKNECSMTGRIYDCDILQPIYDYIEKGAADSYTYRDLMYDCFKSLAKSLNDEYEHNYSDEAVINHVENNEYLFFDNGKEYKG